MAPAGTFSANTREPSDGAALFDARRLDRIKRQVMSNDEAEAVAEDIERMEQMLARIARQQPETLETLRSHGIVFDGPLGNDPKNWQHVAFSIYTDLCEVDTWARAALDLQGTPGPTSLEVASPRKGSEA